MVYNIEGVSNNFSTQLGANGIGSIHVSSSNSKDPSTGRFTGKFCILYTVYHDNLIEGTLPLRTEIVQGFIFAKKRSKIVSFFNA